MNPLLFRARARQVSRRNATFGGLTSDPISTAARVMIASALTLVLTGLLGFVPLPDRVLLSGYLYEPKPWFKQPPPAVKYKRLPFKWATSLSPARSSPTSPHCHRHPKRIQR